MFAGTLAAVRGLHAGLAVALVGAGLIALLSAATLLTQRRNRLERAPEMLGPTAVEALDRAA